MPRLVSQINTLLSPYLALGSKSAATTALGMLNAIGDHVYDLGDWKCLRTPIELNVQTGRFSLDPKYETVLTASLKGVPVAIMDMDVQTKYGFPGKLTRPCGWINDRE
mgnify:CR=1 FL=1